MKIDIETAEALATGYFQTLEQRVPQDKEKMLGGVGGSATNLVRDLLDELEEYPPQSPEAFFQFGVAFGLRAGIATCTMAPTDAIASIDESAESARDMFRDMMEDARAAA